MLEATLPMPPMNVSVEVHLNALTRALASRSLRMYIARCSVDSINQFAPQQFQPALGCRVIGHRRNDLGGGILSGYAGFYGFHLCIMLSQVRR